MAATTDPVIPQLTKGHYTWDDVNNCLEFVTNDASFDTKDKKRRSRSISPAKVPVKKKEEMLSYTIPYSAKVSGGIASMKGARTIGPPRTSPKLGISEYSPTITLKEVKRVALDQLISDLEAIDTDVSLSFKTSRSEHASARVRKFGSRAEKRNATGFFQVVCKRKRKSYCQDVFVRHLMDTAEFDSFLIALLRYFTCFFDQLEQELKPQKSSFLEPSKAELQAITDTKKKLEITKRGLGQSYCILILGLGLEKQHHMGCGKKRVSSTHRDKKMYEDLYLFCTYVVWITFRRKEFERVKIEVGNMLRSEVFNPAQQQKHKALVTAEVKRQSTEKLKKEQPKSEMVQAVHARTGLKSIGERVKELLAVQLPTMERLTPAQHRQKTGKRPAIRTAVYQRSTALVSLLPLPKEESDYLFRSLKGRTKKKSEDEEEKYDCTLPENMMRKIGIIGERTDLFNMFNLMPKNMENEEDGDSADGGNARDSGSPGQSDERPSRQGDAISRVTTAE